jgi:hypothetical protein
MTASKIGHDFRSVSKIEVFKKRAPKLLSLIEKKIHKNLDDSCFSLKIRLWHFLTNSHSLYFGFPLSTRMGIQGHPGQSDPIFNQYLNKF